MPTNSGDSSCAQMLCHLLDQNHDNGAAILSLVDRYVRHFGTRYCNLSFHEQQDIRQEVAIALLCNGSKVRNSCSRSWVYAVVRNQCINHVRKQTTQLTVFKGSDDPEGEASVTGALPSLHTSVDVDLIDRVDCLQKVFDRIEAQDTGKADIAIYTQYAFGMSYREISKRSRRTVDAVGQRITKLKGRLKSLMNECC